VPTFVSVTTFASSATTFHSAKNVNEVKIPTQDELNTWLAPRGNTRLVDTALERLAAQEALVQNYLRWLPESKRREVAPKIVRQFVLLTDGEDNHSRRSAGELRRALLKAQEEKGLVAIFLGANQDAIRSGGAYGFQADYALEFASTAAGYGSAWGSAWRTLREQQRCRHSRCRFDDRDRERARKPH